MHPQTAFSLLKASLKNGVIFPEPSCFPLLNPACHWHRRLVDRGVMADHVQWVGRNDIAGRGITHKSVESMNYTTAYIFMLLIRRSYGCGCAKQLWHHGVAPTILVLFLLPDWVPEIGPIFEDTNLSRGPEEVDTSTICLTEISLHSASHVWEVTICMTSGFCKHER